MRTTRLEILILVALSCRSKIVNSATIFYKQEDEVYMDSCYIDCIGTSWTGREYVQHAEQDIDSVARHLYEDVDCIDNFCVAGRSCREGTILVVKHTRLPGTCCCVSSDDMPLPSQCFTPSPSEKHTHHHFKSQQYCHLKPLEVSPRLYQRNIATTHSTLMHSE